MFYIRIDTEIAVLLYTEEENTYFLLTFLNMNISLIVPVKYFSIHVDETHLEGSMSQNFDRGLSFWFIVCRRWGFANI